MTIKNIIDFVRDDTRVVIALAIGDGTKYRTIYSGTADDVPIRKADIEVKEIGIKDNILVIVIW